MKINHENILLIENWLVENQLAPSLDDHFVRKTYAEVLEKYYKIKNKESIKTRNRAYRLQYDFVRRDLLKILFKKNNYSAVGIRAGFVYAIANPAWPDYVKVGSAIDVIDRLNSYQTSSPHRDYYLVDYYFAHDRLKEEANVHSLYNRNSEWCLCSVEEIKLYFKHRKRETQVSVTEDKLYEVKRKNKILLA